jgi:Uma2 family endonuclease
MATIPLAAPSRHRISVDAFHRMAEAGILAADERVELIDGELFDMSPIGALHAAIVDSLVRHFPRRLRPHHPHPLRAASTPGGQLGRAGPWAEVHAAGSQRCC